MIGKTSIAVFSLWTLLTGAVAIADQRALLVGVGKYSVPGIDLPGIDLDLERMHETLILMVSKTRRYISCSTTKRHLETSSASSRPG